MHNYKELEVWRKAMDFVVEVYRITASFPSEEKFALVQQIRRAALSVHLNLAEGFSRKSLAERNRFFEVSRGSVIEIDAALDISSELGYCTKENLHSLGEYMIRCFSMLSKLISR
jgi:four helix bundle protein